MSAHLERLVHVVRLYTWLLSSTAIGLFEWRICFWRSLLTHSSLRLAQAPLCSKLFVLGEVICWMRCGRRRWVPRVATWPRRCAGFACRVKASLHCKLLSALVPGSLFNGLFEEVYALQMKPPARRLETKALASCTAFQRRRLRLDLLLLLRQLLHQRATTFRHGRGAAVKIRPP